LSWDKQTVMLLPMESPKRLGEDRTMAPVVVEMTTAGVTMVGRVGKNMDLGSNTKLNRMSWIAHHNRVAYPSIYNTLDIHVSWFVTMI
jgi:hypothetical protein